MAALTGAAARDGLVGRAGELDALTTALHDAVGGRGRVVLLAGEPGIGKTRLAEELAAHAAAAGARVVWGRTWEGGGAPPFWPWVEVVRALSPGADAAPELSALIDWSADRPAPSSAEGRFSLFDAVSALLQQRAAACPLVVVLEDLHAADESTLLLAVFVARMLAGWPVLLLATYREIEARRDETVRLHIGELARHGDALALSGLDREQVGELVARVTGTSPTPDVVARVHDATGGNPFYVREVARLADNASDDTVLAVPDSVRQTIRRRLAPLSETARHVLRIAAVIGRDFEVDLVAAASALDRPATLTALEEASDTGLVAATRPGGFTFSHALVFETLCGDLATVARMRLHLDVAHALVRLGRVDDESVAQLAYHYYESSPIASDDDLSAAFAWSVEAGKRAVRRLAPASALTHNEHALALAERGAATEAERGRLLVTLGWNQAHAAGVGPTMADLTNAGRDRFAAAADIARRIDDRDLFGEAAIGFCSGYRVMEADQEMIALAEEALAVLGPEDSPQRVLCLALLADQLRNTDEAERRRALALDAVAMARRVGLHEVLVFALGDASGAWLGDADIETRLRFLNEAVTVDGLPHWLPAYLPPVPDALCDARRVHALFEMGDYAGFDAAMAAYRAKFGTPAVWETHKAPWLMWKATLALLEGPVEQATDDVDRAVAANTTIEGGAGLIFGLRFLQGRLEELEAPLRAMVEQHPTVPVWRSGLALVSCDVGAFDDARRLLDQAIAAGIDAIPLGETSVSTLFGFAWTAHRVNHAAAAELLYEAFLPRDGHWVVAGEPGIVLCNGPVAHVLALLAVTTGRVDAARVHFEAAIAATRARGARTWLAIVLDDWAAFLDAEGDREAARAARAESQRLARALEVGRLLRDPLVTVDAGEPCARAFRLDGDVWRIEYEGATVVLQPAKGLTYLARLLAEPGRELHVLDLAGASAVDRGDAGAALDAAAKAAYQRRLRELRAELAEAEDAGNADAVARTQDEIDFLARELAGAIGLGGRDRASVSSAERARQAVSKVIKKDIKRIAAVHPQLGEHLAGTVRTGVYCSYQPLVPVEWETS